MDLGQGKLSIVFFKVSDTIAPEGRPGFLILAKKNSPFLTFWTSKSFLFKPVDRRKPSTAFSGASVLGPRRSKISELDVSVRPETINTILVGVKKTAAFS